jgi:hypothetical protein
MSNELCEPSLVEYFRDGAVFDERGRRRRGPDGKPLPLPKPPEPGPFKRPAPPEQSTYLTPWGTDDRDPLELIARLAGGTTFTEPSVGRGTSHAYVTSETIAGALGYVKDPLAQRLAMAMACQTTQEWRHVQQLARPRVLAHLRGSYKTRHLVRGYKRFRAQLVLFDAFHDLALKRAVSWRDAAANANMREEDYRLLYQHTAAYLESLARTGAARTAWNMFGE